MKKNTLKTSSDFQGVVLGISAFVKDYRLCYFINKKLNIHLQKPESSSDGLENNNQPFTYIDDKDEWGFNFYLLENKKESGFWYPKYKNVNFILILPGSNAKTILDWLKEVLQSISIIQAVFQIEGEHYQTLKALNVD